MQQLCHRTSVLTPWGRGGRNCDAALSGDSTQRQSAVNSATTHSRGATPRQLGRVKQPPPMASLGQFSFLKPDTAEIMRDLRALHFKPKNGLVDMHIERVITRNEKSVPFVKMVFCSLCL